MKGMNGGMAQLMKQANQMQMKIKKAQEDLNKCLYEGTSGGGAVRVEVNGEHLLQKIHMDPEVMKSGDVEMLQDMVLTAANDAIKKAKETSAKEMEKITGGLSIPGF